MPYPHQACFIEFPILIAVGAIPLTGIIVALIGETNCDAIAVEGPKLFDESVFQFSVPFASEKSDDLLPAIHKFRAVSPLGIYGVGKTDFCRIA